MAEQLPGETSFEFQRVRGEGDVWVAKLTVTYDGGPPSFGISILELRGERIARESIYVTEGFDPPEWRARWRVEP